MRKDLLIIAVIAVAALGAYVFYSQDNNSESPADASPSATPDTRPCWVTPLPDGAVEIPLTEADVHVEVERRTEGNRELLVFHVTESHGYRVDGPRIAFWLQKKDASGDMEMIEGTVHSHAPQECIVDYNEPMESSTVIWAEDYADFTEEELIATSSENWGGACTEVVRVSKLVEEPEDATEAGAEG